MKKCYNRFLLVMSLMISSISLGQTKLLGSLSHMRDNKDGEWYMVDSTKYFYTLGTVADSMHLIQPIDTLNTKWWTNTSTKFFYTNNGNVATRLVLTHDTIKNQYDTNERIIETFSNNKIISRTQETYFKNKMRFSFGEFYTYTNAGKIQKYELKQWDTLSNQWKITQNSVIDTFEYDKNDFLVAKTNKIWNYSKSRIENEKKRVYTNNLAGYPINILEQKWTSTNWYDLNNDSLVLDNTNRIKERYYRYRHQGGMDKWGFQFKTINTYLNTTNLITKSLVQSFDSINKKFATDKNSFQSENEYDKEGNVTHYYEEYFDTLDNQFHSYYELINYYQYDKASVEQISASNFALYPNPASSILTIQSTEGITHIQLFNAEGKELKAIQATNELVKSISVTDLENGVYFVKMNHNHTFKFIKE